MPNGEKRTATPAAASYAEPAPPETFAQQLADLGKGNAAEVTAWVGRCMPGARIDGKQLPAFDLLDPTKTRQYQDVVQNKDFAESKDMLAQRLKVWNAALTSAEEFDSIVESTQQRLEKLEELLDKNLKKAFEVIRPLETTYRAVDAFFLNAAVEEGDKVDASFINASMEQLLSPDDRTVFEEGLAASIQTRFRDWTLKETYSNLCIPGWTGAVPKLDRLGVLGSQNKVHVFTDGENYPTFKGLQDHLDQRAFEGLRGSGLEKQYVTLYGNWLLGRKAHGFEDEDLWLPPSALMTGLVYNVDETRGIHEAPAGYRKGKIKGVEGVRFRIDRPTAEKLMHQYGINPIVDWDGYAIAMGDANLSSKEGLDSFPRIRTEDWLIKNACHYLNKQAYQNITDTFRSAVKSDLHEFLSRHAGDQSEIKSFEIQVTSTPEQERRHEVDVLLTIKFQNSVRQFNVKVKEAEGSADAQVQSS